MAVASKKGKKLPLDIGSPIAVDFTKAERTIARRKYSLSIQNATEIFRDVSSDCVCEGDVSAYLPALTPKLTKAGKVAARQPEVPKRATDWWKTQCAFRGLPVSGTVSDLQQRIRSHGAKGLGRAIEEARNAMRVEIDNEVERRWGSMKDDEKVAAWPRRFLHETFLKDGSTRKSVHVVDVRDWGNGIEAACRAMGVCCELRKMPHHQTGQRTVVLGMDEQAARSKFAELNRDAEKVILKQRKEQERVRKEQEREKQEKSRVFESRFSQAAKIQKGDMGNWDVSGKWTIDCPYVQEQWGSGFAERQWGSSKKSTCELEIKVTTPNDAEMVQIWATFNFIVLTGVFRFVNPEVKSEIISSTGHTRGARGTFEDNYEDYEDNSDDEGMDDQSQFLFSRAALPSSRTKKFQFRWRGEETGEGEIQLYSDEDLCDWTCPLVS